MALYFVTYTMAPWVSTDLGSLNWEPTLCKSSSYNLPSFSCITWRYWSEVLSEIRNWFSSLHKVASPRESNILIVLPLENGLSRIAVELHGKRDRHKTPWRMGKKNWWAWNKSTHRWNIPWDSFLFTGYRIINWNQTASVWCSLMPRRSWGCGYSRGMTS